MKFTSVVTALILACGIVFATEKPNPQIPASQLNGNNELLLPANYRTWVAVSPTAPGMPAHHHDHMISKIYVEPAAYERFAKSGNWPAKSMIVLELRAEPNLLPKDHCDVMGLEVAVKDGAKSPEPWTFYGIIYDHEKHGEAAKAKSVCADCNEQPVDMRLAMYIPALRAVIHAKPSMMPPSAF